MTLEDYSRDTPVTSEALNAFGGYSEFGNPDCCGCLNGVINGDWADIVCDECDAVIRTVSAADLQNTFDEMELTPGCCQ